MVVDLRKLKHLVTVARLGSLSRAAEALHLSQPAISRSIALVEEQMGLCIFHRTPQGVEPSAAGKVAVREAEKLLNQANVFVHNWELYRSGESGSLRFGIWSLLGSVILPELLTHMAIERPKLKLWASVNDYEPLLTQLYNHEIEFLVCRENQIAADPELLSEPIGILHFSVFVRSGHPLTERKPVILEDLGHYTILSGQDPSNVPEYFAETGIFFCENSDVMRQVVLNTDSIWVVPAQLAEADVQAGRLVPLSITSSTTSSLARSELSVHLLRLKDYELSPAAQYARTYLCNSSLMPATSAAGPGSDQSLHTGRIPLI